MAQIGIKKLTASASAVIAAVEAGAAYLITRRGRPVAVLLPIAEAEDLVLADADTYIRMRHQGRASYAKGRMVVLDELD